MAVCDWLFAAGKGFHRTVPLHPYALREGGNVKYRERLVSDTPTPKIRSSSEIFECELSAVCGCFFASLARHTAKSSSIGRISNH